MTCGLSDAEFRQSTPFTLSLKFEVWTDQQTREFRQNQWLVWHLAALTRTKTMPTLEKFLAPVADRTDKELDEVEVVAFFSAHNEKVRD